MVVASVFQTGLNLMRDLLRRGVRTVGVDCHPENEGFRSAYGTSYLCPDPDTDADAWVAFMIDLARKLGARPVIIPAADQFVSAIGRHAETLRDYYIFSLESVAVQAALATKEQQYELARRHGLTICNTAYIQSRREMEKFAAAARFPCLIKPRHQREWEALPEGNPLRGEKLVTAEDAAALLESYSFSEPHRPEVVVMEIIAGGDDAKYCYLSVYGRGSRRLGHCVVQEFRAYPIFFGSGSLVTPVVDPEIDSLCDSFLRSVGYVGICEIEVKRDSRDHIVRLIEANPRFSGTGGRRSLRRGRYGLAALPGSDRPRARADGAEPIQLSPRNLAPRHPFASPLSGARYFVLGRHLSLLLRAARVLRLRPAGSDPHL